MAASRRMPGEPPARGATAQEVAGAPGEAIAINGGPGTVWAPRAYAAFRELAGESSG